MDNSVLTVNSPSIASISNVAKLDDHRFLIENLAQWAALLRKTGDDAGADRMETRVQALRTE